MSDGTAETPLLTVASGGAPGNDFFGQLIDANLQGALYEFLSPVGDQPTIDLPRLLQHIRKLGYRLSEPLPQAQQANSGETLREPNHAMEQDWVDDRQDDPIDQKLQGELQRGGSEPKYLGSEPASGASSGTKGAMAAVTLFSGSIISPKFEIAYVSGIPGVIHIDNAASSTFTGEGLVVVQTESPLLLAARKPVRDKKKGAVSTHRHGKRPRRTSPVEPLKTASASPPLPNQGAPPQRATSWKLRRAAAVAASQRLERGTSPVRHRVPSEESVSEVSATEPVLPEPTTVPKKAVVPATKQKSPEFIEYFTSSSESSDDSVTLLAASRESLPSRGKKASLPKPARARPSSSASASRVSLLARALADMGSSARAASSSASALRARRAADVATDPMTLPLYVSVVERKQANRDLKPKYFK